MQKRIVLSLVVFLLVLIGLVPVLVMLIKSVFVNGHFDLQAYRGLLVSARQWSLMGHSFILAGLVTLLTTLVGVPLGVLFAKSDFPWRNVFVFLFVIPLLIPPYVTAVSWFDLLGREGLLAPLLAPGVIRLIDQWLFGLPGCVFVLFSVFLPVPMILTMAFLKTVDVHLEEAARLTASWGKVLKGITLPLIAPGILLSALLIFLLTFGEFGVPEFLRYPVFPVESFTQFSAFYNFKAATAAATPLAIVTLLALLLEDLFLRERTYQLRPVQDTTHQTFIPLRKARPLLVSAVGALAFFIVILPFSALVLKSASLTEYGRALSQTGGSLRRSIEYAFIGATLLTIFGFLVGYLVQTKALKFWRSVDSVTLFLFALPGTVIGIGLIGLWNRPGTNFIYATPLIIMTGYLAKYTALTSRITVTQLAQVPPSMEEAAQMAGAGWGRRLIFIVAPLAGKGLLVAWIAGYIFSLRDTAITMIVYPAGHDTLPVRIFTLMANGSQELIAALCVILIAATLIPAGLLFGVSRFKRRKVAL